jgi:hypothetical protein
LIEGQRPKFRVVRAALGTGYAAVGGIGGRRKTAASRTRNPYSRRFSLHWGCTLTRCVVQVMKADILASLTAFAEALAEVEM